QHIHLLSGIVFQQLDAVALTDQFQLELPQVELHQEVSKKVSAKDSILFEACILVYRLEVQYKRARMTLSEAIDCQTTQLARLDAVVNTGSTDYLYFFAGYYQVLQPIPSERRLRDHRRACSRIDDEVQRLIRSRKPGLGARQSVSRASKSDWIDRLIEPGNL